MDRFFRLNGHITYARTEMCAGVTAFVTTAYMMFVNPPILSGECMGQKTDVLNLLFK
jgi:xanthine/uracil/vitamin C permease (AzgA family)